jgi:beta-lactamase regulating signal transducer with metallopeptidase domain
MPNLVTLATPMAARVLGWSAETILMASALAATAALAGRLGGRRLAIGPAARHALWLAVLIRLMAPPLLHWPWSIPVPGASGRAEERPAWRVDVAAGGVDEIFIDLDAVPVRPEAPAPRDLRAEAWALVRGLGPWVVAAWAAGSVALATGQVRRIVRFRRRLREAGPAPAWLVEEAGRVGRRLGVRVPPIRVMPGLTTPMLWCLGRPVLLVPDDLLATLERARWRAILAHELAHLRRLDPWVRRLELLAEPVWWWNPLYRLARRRLDFEAELACDAWAVWAWPDDRLSYAESLLQIGSAKSTAAAPAPSLGVAGSALFFERRLTMILRDRVACRVPASGFLAAALLTALALPSWTLAEPARDDEGKDKPRETTAFVVVDDATDANVKIVLDDDDDAVAKAAKQAEEARAKADAALQKLKAVRAKADAEKKAKAEGEKKTKAEGDKSAPKKKEVRLDFRFDEKGPGPEFEKKMEAFGKEMEAKFGPGSEFEKKMKAMGKDMEAKFGPGSEFEKEMKALGKEMEAKFGPGSKFAEEMKALEKETAKVKGDLNDKVKAELDAKVKETAKAQEKRAAEAKARAESFAKEARARAEDRAKEARAKAEDRAKESRARTDRNAGRARTEATTRKARRIEAIEAQIKRLTEELQRIKAEGDEDEDDDKG